MLLPRVSVAALAIVLASCGGSAPADSDGPTTAADVRSAIRSGADCPELYELRNELDPKDPQIPSINTEFRTIGCYMSASTRQDQRTLDAAPDLCMEAGKVAAAEKDPSKANPLIIKTLTDCETADRWLDMVSEIPGVMGMAEGHRADRIDLQAACHGQTDPPVCDDAAKRGMLP